MAHVTARGLLLTFRQFLRARQPDILADRVLRT
jgi:hypothetical protein